MSEDLLYLLRSTNSLEEREEILFRFTLESLESDLKNAIFAVSVPHWFDEEFLLHLLGGGDNTVDKIISQMREVSFLEVLDGEGYAIHERARKYLHKILWKQSKEEYIRISSKAAAYCSRRVQQDFKWRVEEIYHLLIANPSEGTELFQQTCWQLQNAREKNIDKIELISRVASEHLDDGLLDKKSSGWTLFWKAQTEFNYSRYAQSCTLLNLIRSNFLRGNYFLRACYLKLHGDICRKEGCFDLALDYYKNSLPMFRKCKKQRFIATCISDIGEVYRVMGDHKKTKIYFTKAYALFREMGDRLGEANCLFLIGEENRKSLKFPEALKKYDDAIKLYTQIGSLLGKANCVKAKGDVLYMQSLFAKSKSQYEKALNIYQEIKNPLGEAHCLYYLGSVHRSIDEYILALETYERSLEKYLSINNKKGEANCYLSIAGLFSRQKDFRMAEDFYFKSLSLYQILEQKQSQIFVYISLYNIYKKQRDFKKAINLMGDAICRFPDEVSFYTNRAEAFMTIGDLEAAKTDLETACSINPKYPTTYLQLGELSLVLKDYNAAEKSYQTLHELLPDISLSFFCLGKLSLIQGIFIQALEWYQKGLRIASSQTEIEEEINKLRSLTTEDKTVRSNITEMTKILENFTLF